MRKNVDIWSKWHSAMGTSMHKLQLSVAVQCARQLATGGRMVTPTLYAHPNPSPNPALSWNLASAALTRFDSY